MALQCLEQRGVAAVVREKTTTEKEVSFTVESNNLGMIKRWILVLVAAALLATALLLVPATPASAGEENFGRLASANAQSLDSGLDSGLPPPAGGALPQPVGVDQGAWVTFYGPHGVYDPHW